jgi:NADPH:quinone reductase-like Zn-dependent oxidoreductase
VAALTPAASDTMDAIVHRRYGSPDVLEFTTVERPTVGDDTVLVRVRAASLNAFDWHVMRGHPYVVRTSAGLRRPTRRVAGVDLAGDVEAVGRNVREFRPGDAVFGERGGALAEYVCAGTDNFVLKPANLTYEQAAAVPMAGFTALQALRDKGHVQAGQRVLVNGAAGGVGTFAVQLAKAFGAEVTAVCRTEHVELLRSIGADRVIDYTNEDVTKADVRYDLILDVAANHPVAAFRRLLRPGGTFIVVGAPPGNWFAPLRRPLVAAVLSRFGSRRMLPFLAERRKADLTVLKDLIEAGKLTPVVDRTYPLRETAAAMRHLEDGHPGGKVVVTV